MGDFEHDVTYQDYLPVLTPLVVYGRRKPIRRALPRHVGNPC